MLVELVIFIISPSCLYFQLNTFPDRMLTLARNAPDSKSDKTRSSRRHILHPGSLTLSTFLILLKVAYQHRGSMMMPSACSLEKKTSEGSDNQLGPIAATPDR